MYWYMVSQRKYSAAVESNVSRGEVGEFLAGGVILGRRQPGAYLMETVQV